MRQSLIDLINQLDVDELTYVYTFVKELFFCDN